MASEGQTDLLVRALQMAHDRIARERGAREELEIQLRHVQRVEVIGRLAGGIVHDFNNLLTIIMGCAEIAAADVEPTSATGMELEEIRRVVQTAATLTRQLLMFNHRRAMPPTIVDVNRTVGRLTRMIQRVVGERIDVVIHTTAEAPSVRVDEVQLEQVILNLAVNARDAMPAGGVLTITTAIGVPEESVVMNHGDAADRVFVKLTVTDTGVGMARNVMGDIFTPFFTTKREGVGTGLGLAIVQGIIRDAGGFIDVQSEIGRGSSFSVHLPLAGGSPDAVVEPPVAADVVDASGTILFVEDDPQVLNMAARALRHQGFRVLTAENGAEALQLADEHETIDLLLTDVVLPDAGGAALAQALRSLRPNLKVLYTSGYAEVEELFGQPELNREAFVRKPWTPLELARHVRHLLEATS